MGDRAADRTDESAIGRRVERALQQAPVEPLHDDGVRAFGIGTVAFALVLVVLAFGGRTWQLDPWWLHVAISGVVIGLLATAYCVWRRNKRAREAAAGIRPSTP